MGAVVVIFGDGRLGETAYAELCRWLAIFGEVVDVSAAHDHVSLQRFLVPRQDVPESRRLGACAWNMQDHNQYGLAGFIQ